MCTDCKHKICGNCLKWDQEILYTFEEIVYGGVRKLGLAKWERKNGDGACGGP